jgi:type 1 glutamine amidotransferase
MNLRAAVRAAIGLAALVSLLSAHGKPVSAASSKPTKRLLVISATKGYRHDSIPIADETIRMLGRKGREWQTDVALTEEDLAQKTTRAALKRYDAILFANTTGVLPLADPKAFLDFIRAGHGFGAIHSGADTFHFWPYEPPGTVSSYVKMLGGEFAAHHQQSSVRGRIVDPAFPACKALIAWQAAHRGQPPPSLLENSYVAGNAWYGFDEMYLFKHIDFAHLHALVQMDTHPSDPKLAAAEPPPWLISWCKAYGKGRVFYCSFGHRREMWRDPLYQNFIAGGIRWMLGLAGGSTAPNLAPKPR